MARRSDGNGVRRKWPTQCVCLAHAQLPCPLRCFSGWFAVFVMTLCFFVVVALQRLFVLSSRSLVHDLCHLHRLEFQCPLIVTFSMVTCVAIHALCTFGAACLHLIRMLAPCFKVVGSLC